MSDSVEAKSQFRILYRQFLFRVVDLEALSADAMGDSNKLLGQFAALLVVISILGSFGVSSLIDARNMPPATRLSLTLLMSHVLVATNVLVVGIFAVLSWDSIFPDRRDVLVLAPLPVRASNIFLAKLAAGATALGLVIVLLNCATGLIAPFAFAQSATLLGIVRSFIAYWFAMFAAGLLVYCGLLAIQGLVAHVLSRRLFLRASGVLQMGCFCLFVCAYFLEPQIDNLKMLTAPEYRAALLWLPTYWFFGLFHQLNGSMHSALEPLAHRAWMGLAVGVIAAAGAYVVSYIRTIRQIVEEPDITPGLHGFRWLPRFGDGAQTAIGQFCVRALARSRQHRLIFAFYLGIGLAFTILLLQFLATNPQEPGVRAPDIWHQANAPLLVATIMMLVLAVLGARVAFSFPLELRANWIFRSVGMPDPEKILIAARRALLLISAVPIWLTSAAVCFWLWPWRQAGAHVVVLALLGMILVDLALWNFHKVPFACSYLPGKSQVHMAVIAAVILVMLVAQSVLWEQQALLNSWKSIAMLAAVAAAAATVRRVTNVLARSDETALQFEEADPAALLQLGLSHEEP